MTEPAKVASDRQQARLLEAVGLSDDEERTYILLIDQPGSTLTEVASMLHVARNRARVTLDSLTRTGLITRTPDKTPRYLPAPPDIAVEALIAQRQQELERVRKAAARLSRKATKSRSKVETELAEIISGTEAVAAHLDQLQRDAQEEVVALIRPPFPFDGLSGNSGRLAALERGVRFRVVYDRATLAAPDDLEPVSAAIDAGEQARVHSPIPATLIIADRRVGLIPFDLHDPEAGWLLLRPSSVLDVLVSYFNSTWDHAAPLQLTAPGDLEVKDAGDETENHRLLLELMAAGLRDEAIAGHLDVSQRTIDRRVRAVMDELRATTRFQAGWLAAQRAMEPKRAKRRRKKS